MVWGKSKVVSQGDFANHLSKNQKGLQRISPPCAVRRRAHGAACTAPSVQYPAAGCCRAPLPVHLILSRFLSNKCAGSPLGVFQEEVHLILSRFLSSKCAGSPLGVFQEEVHLCLSRVRFYGCAGSPLGVFQEEVHLCLSMVWCYGCAGSPLGVFQEEAGTRRGLLSTALRGGCALVTPAPGAPAAPAHAVATVVRRDKPGTGPAPFVLLCCLYACLSRHSCFAARVLGQAFRADVTRWV